MNKKHLGSDPNDFLREERLLDVSEAAAEERLKQLNERVRQTVVISTSGPGIVNSGRSRR